MKKYYIQSRIRTGAEILSEYTHNEEEKDINKRFKSEFEYEWLHFQQWDFSVAKWVFGDSWIISWEIESESSVDAINKYLKKQNEALSKIFFCVPVWHSYWFHHALLISDDNFQAWFYFMRIESKWTWLVITPEIVSSIKKQDFGNIPKKFFSFYAEHINATTALALLSLGCIALESILPQWNEARKVILWEDLFYRIFSSDKNAWRKQGFRNKIFHGIYFDDGDSTEKDYSDLNEAIKLALISRNEKIKDIFSLRDNFNDIPRQRTRIDWFGWVYLKSGNKYWLNIKDLVNSDSDQFSKFQSKIKDDYWIEVDINQKIENY